MGDTLEELEKPNLPKKGKDASVHCEHLLRYTECKKCLSKLNVKQVRRIQKMENGKRATAQNKELLKQNNESSLHKMNGQQTTQPKLTKRKQNRKKKVIGDQNETRKTKVQRKK